MLERHTLMAELLEVVAVSFLIRLQPTDFQKETSKVDKPKSIIDGATLNQDVVIKTQTIT